LGAPVNGCGQIQVMAPLFCDTDGENRGFGSENSDGLARRLMAGAVETNGNRQHGVLRILLSVGRRHIVFPEYKKFLIEIRLDRRRVIRAWTCMPVRKEVHHVL
jgi:hypothetical protein